METDEIAWLVEGLRVSVDAKLNIIRVTVVDSEKGQKRLERAVVGNIFSKRTINREIELVGHNLFVVTFLAEADKHVVLNEGHWHFFNDLMILKQTEPMQTLFEVDFSEFSLWVQCHNVPIDCMEPEIIRKIGGRIGKVEEIDVGEGSSCLGRFTHVRVARKIDDPLLRCIPLVHESLQKEVIVILQYEKLPEFCFVCGRVGHISKDCGEEGVDKGVFHFDSWLRAGVSFVGRRQPDMVLRSSSSSARGRGRGGLIRGGFGERGQDLDTRGEHALIPLNRADERLGKDEGGREGDEQSGEGRVLADTEVGAESVEVVVSDLMPIQAEKGVKEMEMADRGDGVGDLCGELRAA